MVNLIRIKTSAFVITTAITLVLCGVVFATNLIHDKPKVDSASLELDILNNTMILPDVRITTESGYVIKAGQARTTDINNFKNGRWTFVNKVDITTPQGSSHADGATVSFVNNEISTVHLEGHPATFEEHGAEKLIAQGHADNIDYDLAQLRIKLSNNVWFSNDQIECRGVALVYNITQQKISFNPEDQQGQRVNCTINPAAVSTSSKSAIAP